MVEVSREARRTFDWLIDLGYSLTETQVSDGDNARYDGWHLSYASNDIAIRIEYYEWELNVILKKGTVVATYLFLDRQIFNNVSGLQGNMISPEKLPNIMARISDDLARHYRDILMGDAECWEQISKLSEEYKKHLEFEAQKEARRDAYSFDRLKAAEAFTARDYAKVVKLLSPIVDYLEPLELKKLDYAKKKMQSG